MNKDDQSGKGSILLSGASGILGSALGQALQQRGAGVVRLVRRAAQSPGELSWNPAADSTSGKAIGIETMGRLEGLDAAVHLSGANVSARRWDAAYKREMTESRVTSTRVLAEAIARLKRPPKTLVTASAVGFYGDRGEEILDESSTPGVGYLAEMCVAWEAATRAAVEPGIRVVHLRFGVVIGPQGGAMGRMMTVFRLGLGGRLGSGRQWMSWVSEADAVGIALFALGLPGEPGVMGAGTSLEGPVNVAAPVPVTNAEFTRELGRALHRPAVLPAPAFALRLVFGEMADEALLASTRAVPRRLLEAGYRFRHPTLAEALAAAVAR